MELVGAGPNEKQFVSLMVNDCPAHYEGFEHLRSNTGQEFHIDNPVIRPCNVNAIALLGDGEHPSTEFRYPDGTIHRFDMKPGDVIFFLSGEEHRGPELVIGAPARFTLFVSMGLSDVNTNPIFVEDEVVNNTN